MMIYKNKWILVLSMLIMSPILAINATGTTKAAEVTGTTKAAAVTEATKASEAIEATKASEAIEATNATGTTKAVEGSEVTEATKENEAKNTYFLSFINNTPPPGFIYLTFFLALVTFSWKIIEFLVNRIDKSKERLAGLKSEYWFKYIIMPMCATPLIDFIMQYANKVYILSSECSGAITDDNRKKYDEFLREFKDEKSFISCKFFLLDSLDGDLYQDAADTFDEIDDIVTQHCYLSSINTATTDDRHYEDVSIVRQNMIYKLNAILAELYIKYKDANKIS